MHPNRHRMLVAGSIASLLAFGAVAGAAAPAAAPDPVPYDGCQVPVSGSCTFHCQAGWSVHIESLNDLPALGVVFEATASCGGVTAHCVGVGFCSAHAAFTDREADGSCTVSGVAILVQCRAY